MGQGADISTNVLCFAFHCSIYIGKRLTTPSASTYWKKQCTNPGNLVMICEGINVLLVPLELETILSMIFLPLPNLHLFIHIPVPLTLGIQYCVGTLWRCFTSCLFPTTFRILQDTSELPNRVYSCLHVTRASFSAKCHQQIIIVISDASAISLLQYQIICPVLKWNLQYDNSRF